MEYIFGKCIRRWSPWRIYYKDMCIVVSEIWNLHPGQMHNTIVTMATSLPRYSP